MTIINPTHGVDLYLTSEQALELASLLDGAIRDMSPEIADTENPSYRTMLRERRGRLRAIHEQLSSFELG